MVINDYDICIIGAGHAGCEAALACARSGLKVIVFTVSIDAIAMMPCNPNIGGSSKGHLVKELDALGGQMAKNIDATFIQSKMLNRSKGPAVHSLRAQADKAAYALTMRRALEENKNIDIKQGEVSEILYETMGENCFTKPVSFVSAIPSIMPLFFNYAPKKKIIGVKTFTDMTYACKAVIICCGVYLKSRCLCGQAITDTGPNGLQNSSNLSVSLTKMGLSLRRFKTGTPARMDKDSLDYTKMTPQYGDVPIVPFSFSTKAGEIQKEQIVCYLAYTNEKTHEIIKENIASSPMYSGEIKGIGPRYCPSIEDKVMRFADKDRHQIFIEPEGLNTNEVYLAGMSSSLPEDVQLKLYRSIEGFENCKMVRNAYAIEYDCLDSGQLELDLSVKGVDGLFSAGQFNGSSGYEEAAAQGLIAGINAVNFIEGKAPLILKRSESYIGVLIDDLVNKDITEPYRMMTARAEFRLLLRQDNADLRLRRYGFESGLVEKVVYDKVVEKKNAIDKEIKRLSKKIIGATSLVNDFLKGHNSACLQKGVSLFDLISRPELDYNKLSPIDADRPDLPQDVIEQVNIEIKYSGYIKRQENQVKQFLKYEGMVIPQEINFRKVTSLRLEAVEKLSKLKPQTIGQASRISGVTPADINVLLVYIKAMM